MNQNETTSTQKLAIAGVLTAAAVAGSLISVPVAGSKCAPVQHMVNVFSAVILGPWWKSACFPGKHGRCPVLWTDLPLYR